VRRLLGAAHPHQHVHTVEMLFSAFLAQELSLDEPTTLLAWQQ
jgi:hypothetical protein